MTEMIERMARAMCMADFPFMERKWHEATWPDYQKHALSVLTEVRSISEESDVGIAMIMAGGAVLPEGCTNGDALCCWKAMLDVVIGEANR